MAAQVNIDFLSYLFKAIKSRGYNPLQTLRCFPLGVYNTDQGKDLVGNYIISYSTTTE